MYVAAGTALFVLLVTTVRSIYRPRGVTRMSGYFRHHLGDSYCDRLESGFYNRTSGARLGGFTTA